MKKRKFSLFDKFWYLKRTENFDLMAYGGVHMDGQQCVELDFKCFFNDPTVPIADQHETPKVSYYGSEINHSVDKDIKDDKDGNKKKGS